MVSLFEGIRTLLTSSHVVGELQGLQHLQDQRRREFWLYAMTWLASKGMQEELVRLLDLNSNTNRQKAVCEIGPTDTGLVELAFREGAVLLTDDERMFAHVDWAQGVDCRLVKNLLFG
jgi:hypothetical protein